MSASVKPCHCPAYAGSDPFSCSPHKGETTRKQCFLPWWINVLTARLRFKYRTFFRGQCIMGLLSLCASADPPARGANKVQLIQPMIQNGTSVPAGAATRHALL